MFGRKKGFSAARIDTLVGQGTEINGDLVFSGGLHVDGTINGNVVAMKEIGDRLDGKANQENDVNVRNTGAVSYKHRGISEFLEVLDDCERRKQDGTPEGTLSR